MPVPDAVRPKILRVEPTNQCSRSCIMCPNKQIIRDQGIHHLHPTLIPQGLFESVRDVVFLQNGEFTEAKYLQDILVLLQRYPVRLHVTTNGTNVTDGLLEQLLATSLASITFSIDSVDPIIFASIRRGCHLDVVLRGVRRVILRKRETDSILPIVQTNVTIMRRNIEALPEALLTLADLGVDVIRVDYARLHRFSVETGDIDRDESLYFHQDLSDKTLAQCRRIVSGRSCKVWLPPMFGRVVVKEDDPSSGQHIANYCQQPWTDAVIWANGNVTPCTGAQEVIWGNLRESSFESIWRCRRANNFRRRLESPHCPKACLQCVCVAESRTSYNRKSWHVL